MKNNIKLVLFVLYISFYLFACGQSKDAVKKANEVNEKKADANVVSENIAEFLVKSADARMMDLQEGELAFTKGSIKEVREYGALMIKDQAILLEEIKKIAGNKNITLPSSISDQKKKGRENLSEKEGKEFDEKFIKMMKIDHERDLKLFEKAKDFDDMETKLFANKYLPMIKSHLDKVIIIEEIVKY